MIRQVHKLHCRNQLKEQVEAQDLEAQGLAEAALADEQPVVQASSREDNLTVGQVLETADPRPRGGDPGDVQLHIYI
ncbi:hypothetical protein C0993_007224 [Termitomyces sp. T159_Od127]|nr:hypothetical protein C0993_007224 [Termitomyces sp. T159_Od127]